MAESTRSYGEIVCTLHEARVVVDEAPDWAVISLEVLVGANRNLLFCVGDTLFLGDDPWGNEVAYRVVGWDPSAMGLKCERVGERPPAAQRRERSEPSKGSEPDSGRLASLHAQPHFPNPSCPPTCHCYGTAGFQQWAPDGGRRSLTEDTPTC